jgi:hypothetical protein
MFAKVVSILCLACVATALPVPQIIPSGLGYSGLGLGGVALGGIPGVAVGGYPGVAVGGYPGVAVAGIPRIHGIGGYGLGSVGHATVGYAPRVAYASPAISSLGYPAIGIPKIAVAAPPVLHKTIIASPIDPNPQYSYNYGVNDPHTGDSKHAEETLVNGVVHGSYSLAEPDGTIRKVTYTADKINGFNAVVERHGVSHHTAPIHKVITPAVHAVAPAIHAPAILSPAYATGYPAYH